MSFTPLLKVLSNNVFYLKNFKSVKIPYKRLTICFKKGYSPHKNINILTKKSPEEISRAFKFDFNNNYFIVNTSVNVPKLPASTK